MRRFSTISVMAFLAVTLAACGGGGSSGTTTPIDVSGNPSTSFSVASVPGVGKVVVDGSGRRVYVLTAGGKKNVPCTGGVSGCTNVWPDLGLPGGATGAKAGAGLDASLLGTMRVAGGTYPTYNGYLMYEYTGDTDSGQANGQGLKSFGGTWYVLNASGNPVKSGSGGGY
jgi:hypothetical protein